MDVAGCLGCDLLAGRYRGLRSEQLQARMLATGEEPGAADVERFCDQAHELFRPVSSHKGRATETKSAESF